MAGPRRDRAPGFTLTPDDEEGMVQVASESPPSMGALQFVPEPFGADGVNT